jgi:hypothetical protein
MALPHLSPAGGGPATAKPCVFHRRKPGRGWITERPVLISSVGHRDLCTTIRQNLVFLARNSAVRVRNPKDGLYLSPAGGGGRRKATGGGLFGFDFGCG